MSEEWDLCHYLYFKNIGFKHEQYLCNGCHDLLRKAVSFNNVAIIYVNRNAYRIHFWYMSKNDAINKKNGSNLVDKKDVLKILLVIYKIFLIYIYIDWWECWFNLLSRKLRRNTK